MARQARIVIPGLPHHVGHRGNLRAQVFFSDAGPSFYLEVLGRCATASREFIKALELDVKTSMACNREAANPRRQRP